MVKVGIDRIDEYSNMFKGKRVGLITNPTGVNEDFVSTIDVLSIKTNLVALFSPEHGVRGELQAGVRLDDFIDEDTGCRVYSLYGKNKKPSKEMLENIDILVYDIQPVGARFYTFIYTLAYAMIACSEYGKKMVVLDRPNPVNGNKVEGNILDIKYRSFVGYYPIPQRYGLTIGELGNFFNSEFDIKCDLEVLEMTGYQRSMDYQKTGLKWVLPSPNLPTPLSCYAYLSTCVFEGTNMSEGRGTTKPFQIIGSPYLNNIWLKVELDKLNLKGIEFRTLYFTPTFSKHKDVVCKGLEFYITDPNIYEPVKTGYVVLDLIKKHHPEFSFIPPYKEGMNPMIDLLTGGNYVRENTKTIEEQLDIITKDSKIFEIKKRRYHLYE